MQDKKEEFHAQPYVNREGKCSIGDGFNLELHPEFIPYDVLRHKVENGLLGGGRVSRSFEALWHDMEPKKGR